MDNGAVTRDAADGSATGTAAGAAGTATGAGAPAGVGATRGLVVVGPGAAFGTALLRRFAGEGFALGVISRSSDTISRVSAELGEAGYPIAGAVADVTDQRAFSAAVSRLAAEIGGLNVLVYNAKLSIRGTAFSVRADSMNQTLAVNVTGALMSVQIAAPLMADRPGATILLTVAGPRSEPAAGRFALAVGKAGVAAMGESMAPLLAAQGIRLRTVVIDGRVGPAGPLLPDAVADHFFDAFAAPGGTAFRLAPAARRRRANTQLPLEV
ncbi:SDR family oxidoreductase [Parafrankia sp. EUN1f]|uniref:SDR family NAD(P)-dependent oxidoreductase n=1 Tax=Parafrankia sp. EUN1f TaxID=102897 RepID=UPI0001C43ED9|nr:SDR family NAD(P)-dependent oxidoreductase [Parafrankia sp. EUN1f]EFC84260.1 short-chain dehydrogenase/reductase SDR [Parafrankia sp. EUN1f]